MYLTMLGTGNGFIPGQMDSNALLEENGCRIMYFSPIHDSEIPHDADGVIFWGGYPERYAKELSENKSMIKSVKKVIDSGIACIAYFPMFTFSGTTLPYLPTEKKRRK